MHMETDRYIKDKWRISKQEYRRNHKEYAIILDLDQAQALEQRAAEYKLKVPGLMKLLIQSFQDGTTTIRRDQEEFRNLILELRSIGNSINQLVRHCNDSNSVSFTEIQELRDVIHKIEIAVINKLANKDK